ncbi:hypothetical protein J2Z79_000722 [Symbiobacterium terraclitae]|uniref:Uncharacterized protein n=1 Tax=Symbiobacterium terraclitae TaxID=557451 RepID=A0ABS4JP78_9FIRM|nr:hypothetical protein [Symbiobacterium terraclitae]MBP2017339.1 hypothetical protein [Symbiobacterium terraclitae]
MRSEGFGTEGIRTEGVQSEGFSSEWHDREGVGASAPLGARSPSAGREGPDSAAEAPALAGPAPSPLAAQLLDREGLARAVLLAEVLGKPRALRPYGRR